MSMSTTSIGIRLTTARKTSRLLIHPSICKEYHALRCPVELVKSLYQQGFKSVAL